jgi:two-component system OmpR family response regulator
VLSREVLLKLTRGRNQGALDRSVDVLVSRLRQKIEVDPQDAVLIKTVRQNGYLFTPIVEAIDLAAKIV